MAPQQHRPLVPLTPRTRSIPRALPGVALSETKEAPPAWLPCWLGAPVGGLALRVAPGFLGLPSNSTTAWEDPGLFQVTSKKMGTPHQTSRSAELGPPPRPRPCSCPLFLPTWSRLGTNFPDTLAASFRWYFLSSFLCGCYFASEKILKKWKEFNSSLSAEKEKCTRGQCQGAA